MSELFGPHDTLILYSFMYGPERDLPCPGCTHLLDGIDGAARHIGQRAASISSPNRRSRVSPPGRTNAAGNTFRCCLPRATATTRIISATPQIFQGHARAAQGAGRRELGRNDLQRVQEENGAIRHFWGSEMGFAPPAPKQHHRAGDLSRPALGPSKIDTDSTFLPRADGSFWPLLTSRRVIVGEHGRESGHRGC